MKNNSIRKAASGAQSRNGLNQNLKSFAGGKQKRFDVFNFMPFVLENQCKRCGSPDLKYSTAGYCRRCDQRCEFIAREYPHVIEAVRNQRRGERV